MNELEQLMEEIEKPETESALLAEVWTPTRSHIICIVADARSGPVRYRIINKRPIETGEGEEDVVFEYEDVGEEPYYDHALQTLFDMLMKIDDQGEEEVEEADDED